MYDLYRPRPGTPVEELDTPCLILDMDALDHNMDVMANYYEGRHSKLRGHSKNHKTPAVALRQIRRGGTIGGVCAAKVSEAEVMVHGGVPSVFVTSEVVDPAKIQRLCTLAQGGGNPGCLRQRSQRPGHFQGRRGTRRGKCRRGNRAGDGPGAVRRPGGRIPGVALAEAD